MRLQKDHPDSMTDDGLQRNQSTGRREVKGLFQKRGKKGERSGMRYSQ